MRIEELLGNHGIAYVAEGHPHCTMGWVNIHCPFCPGSRDYHLGVSRENPAVSHCWRCGTKSTVDVFSRTLSISKTQAAKIVEQAVRGVMFAQKKPAPDASVSIHPFRLPQPLYPLNGLGRKYLARRNFDPEYLVQEWGLRQTGPSSFLDDIFYGKRLFIPITWGGPVVSFQTRDITEMSDRKYLACPMRRETIHHKNIVYAHPQTQAEKRDKLIVVEGVTDVWRLGRDAVATFGIAFKMEQVLVLSRMADTSYILFDNEPQAQAQAGKLATKLRALGKEVAMVTVDSDPGSMQPHEADYLLQQLGMSHSLGRR